MTASRVRGVRRAPADAPQEASSPAARERLRLTQLLNLPSLTGTVLQRRPSRALQPYSQNTTAFGRHLARVLRTDEGLSHLPDGADGWCHGGCWPLARALARWARTHGWEATPLAVQGWPSADMTGPGHLDHMICEVRDRDGDRVYLDGDGVAHVEEVLARLRAEMVFVRLPLVVPTDAACRRSGFGDYPAHGDEALVAFLHRVLDPMVARIASAVGRESAPVPKHLAGDAPAAARAPRRSR